MNKKQKRILLVVGIIALILSAICFSVNRYVEDYGIATNRVCSASAITGVDVSSDEIYTVLADRFEKVYLLDNETGNIKWIKSASEMGQKNTQIGKVFFDEKGNVYVHIMRYDADYQYLEEESILKYDPDGNRKNIFVIPDQSFQKTSSQIRGFKCQDGYIYYYNEATTEFVRMDVESGNVENYGQYDSAKIDDAFSLGFTADDTITLAYTDGTLALGSADGSTEEIGRINYHLDEEEAETIVNQYFYIDRRHYITDGRYFDAVYEYEDGKLINVMDIKSLLGLDPMMESQYYEYALDSGISAHDNGNGTILITYLDYLFYTKDMNEFVMQDKLENYNLPAGLLVKGWLKSVCHVLFYVFGFIAIILLGGSIMKWRFSLRSKLFVIIMPVTIGGIWLVTYYEMNMIEKDFVKQQYEEYDAIATFYRGQIDDERLSSVTSLDDIDAVEQERLSLMKTIGEGSDWQNQVNINVYRYFDNNVHLLLYSTTTDCLFVSSFYYDFDENTQYRLPDSDTYQYETRGLGSTYLDNITLLRDESGEVYGFIDVYGNLDQLTISQNQLKKKVIVITIILGLILGTLLYTLGYYIIRHLRMTSRVVGSIAQGDFNARVEKLTKDELGVISQGVNDMADKIEFLFEEQEELSSQVIETLVNTIDAKDKYTNGHSIRVAKYSKMIAQKLGKSSKECKQIYYVGLLHDIGKIGVPDEIINKTARLTDDEFAIIKTHPDVGNKLLSKLTKIENVSIGAHYHHERFDGKGYPEGLKGEEIPEIARIIAVADTYDAMTSNRSYRKAMEQVKVRGELEKGKGTQFDPFFADKMLEIDLEIQNQIYENT